MENKFSKAPQLTNALKKRRTYSEDKKDVTVLVKKKSPSLDFNYQSFHSIRPSGIKCPSLRFYRPFELLRLGEIALKKKFEELFVSENSQMYSRVR